MLTLVQLAVSRRNEAKESGNDRDDGAVPATPSRRAWMALDGYLHLGLAGGRSILMFGPAFWLVSSSFKSPAQLAEFPPSLLPYVSRTAVVPGYDKPLPLFVVKMENGETRELAEIRRIGIVGQMVDPAKPGEIIRVNI